MAKTNKKVSSGNKPYFVLSRRAVAGWAGVIFFVCAWMFVIGILVGRGTSPVKFDIAKLQEKLEAARKNLENRQPGRSENNSSIVKDKTKLDFYEALKENRKDAKVEQVTPPKKITKKKEPLPEKKSFKAETKRTPEKAKLPKQNTDKAKPPKTEPAKPPPKKQIASKSKAKPSAKPYTIQAASVKVAKDADRLVAELKKKGFPAYRAIGKIPGKGIWFRVRIGEYRSKADARSTLQKLKKAGMKPILVKKQ